MLKRGQWSNRAISHGGALMGLGVAVGVLLLLRAPTLTAYLIGEASADSLWRLWWPSHCLRYNYDCVYTNYASYPQPENLLTGLSWTHSLIFWLVDALSNNPALAYNLTLFISLMLTAWAGYGFFAREGRLYGLAGGLGLALFPVTVAALQSESVVLVGGFAALLCLWCFDRWLAGRGHPIWVALSAYLMILTAVGWLNVWFSLLLPYMAYRIYQEKAWENIRPHLPLMLILLAALMFYYPLPALLRSTYIPRYSPVEVIGVASLSGLLTLSAVIGAGWLSRGRFWVALGAIHALLLALPGLAPLNLVGWLFAVPHNPNLTSPLFFAWALGFISLLWLREVKGERLLPVVLALVMLPLLIAPLPRSPRPASDFYHALSDEDEDYLILEYPAPQPGYLASHEKRLIAAAHPDWYSLPFPEERIPYLQAEVYRERIGYVVLALDQLTPEEQAALRENLTRLGVFCPVASEGGQEVWRARWHPAGCD